jgi:hypothetical protein
MIFCYARYANALLESLIGNITEGRGEEGRGEEKVRISHGGKSSDHLRLSPVSPPPCAGSCNSGVRFRGYVAREF